MATRTYRLKIAREGYEFEAEGDKPFVMEMLRRFVPKADAEIHGGGRWFKSNSIPG